MPAKNILKQYLENGIYHIYNRGVEKRNIFMDNQDYKTFLYFLKIYLQKPSDNSDDDSFRIKSSNKKNFSDKIELLCYCLMPNHFHLLIKQKEEKDITDFMRCLLTNYSMYFNRKHKRIGSLFQGRYKAVLVQDDNYLLHLTRYIHLNPIKKITKNINPEKYDYSSYKDYLGLRNTKWIKPNFILEYFKENKKDILINKASYKNFVESYKIDSGEILGNLILE